VTFLILGHLKKGKYPSQIARELKCSRQSVSKHIKRLKKLGWIRENFRTSYSSFELTERGITSMELHDVNQVSQGATEQSIQTTIDIHNIRITLPLVKDAEVPWEEKSFHNWNPKMKKVPILGANFIKTPKSILLNIYAKKARDPNEIYRIITTHIVLAASYLKDSYGIEVDLANYRLSGVHFHSPDPGLDKFVTPGLSPSLSIGRGRAKIGPGDKETPATAWADGTPVPGRETNDLVHAQRYLEMPETVNSIFTLLMAKDGLSDAVKDLRNNWVSHKAWIDSGIETNRMLKSFLQGALRKLHIKEPKRGQTNLGDYA
jgi:DNA-binding Lrp family transcriptional regulator